MADLSNLCCLPINRDEWIIAQYFTSVTENFYLFFCQGKSATKKNTYCCSMQIFIIIYSFGQKPEHNKHCLYTVCLKCIVKTTITDRVRVIIIVIIINRAARLISV